MTPLQPFKPYIHLIVTLYSLYSPKCLKYADLIFPFVGSGGGMIDRSAAITAARSQPLPGRDGAPYRTHDSARSKAVTHHLTAEPRRLKSKREEMERRKLLAARTGSLYDFIGHTPSPSSSLLTSSLVGSRMASLSCTTPCWMRGRPFVRIG